MKILTTTLSWGIIAALPPFVQGLINLLNDLTSWLLLLIPIVGVIYLMMQSMKGMAAEDEQEGKLPKKLVMKTLGWVIFGEIVAGVVTWATSYFTPEPVVTSAVIVLQAIAS